LVEQDVDVSSNEVLDHEEEGCYPYTISFPSSFTPEPGATYRVDAKITIDNHSGSKVDGPTPKSDGFKFPSEPKERDASATISDKLTCPAGFTCWPSGPWTWTANDDWTRQLEITVTNTTVCNATLVNEVTLTESNSGQQRTAEAEVTITAPDCQTETGDEGEMEGCTRTQGYWKNHLDAWQEYSPYAPFFTSGQTWLEVLWTPPRGGDAYYILAHQYIAAVLNVANGATAPDSVQEAIDAATAYFNGTSSPDHGQVVAWAETLAQFNEGYLGPGHCTSSSGGGGSGKPRTGGPPLKDRTDYVTPCDQACSGPGNLRSIVRLRRGK
jgi:hypothetical protein